MRIRLRYLLWAGLGLFSLGVLVHIFSPEDHWCYGPGPASSAPCVAYGAILSVSLCGGLLLLATGLVLAVVRAGLRRWNRG